MGGSKSTGPGSRSCHGSFSRERLFRHAHTNAMSPTNSPTPPTDAPTAIGTTFTEDDVDSPVDVGPDGVLGLEPATTVEFIDELVT